MLTTVLYIAVSGTCFSIKLQAGSDVAVFCCLGFSQLVLVLAEG